MTTSPNNYQPRQLDYEQLNCFLLGWRKCLKQIK